ncbi:MAG: hypothetical protein ACPGCO_08285 [Flavobacteriaceae bacterium]
MKKEQFKDITLTIPAHVLEALWWSNYDDFGERYAEFDLSLKVSKKGELEVWDMLGVWSGEWAEKPHTPEEAWALIADWRPKADKLAQLEILEEQVNQLKKEIGVPKKKGWFK